MAAKGNSSGAQPGVALKYADHGRNNRRQRRTGELSRRATAPTDRRKRSFFNYTGAMPMQYTITLKGEELGAIMNALAQFPYQQVAPLIRAIESQVEQQNGAIDVQPTTENKGE